MPKALRVGVSSVVAVAVLIGSHWLGGRNCGQAFAEPYRLGFSGRDVPGSGVQVVSVAPGSPATRLYRVGGPATAFALASGDVITAVDGKPVRSLAEYYRAMEAATPGQIVITVRDANGRSADWATRPSGAGGDSQGGQPPHENAGKSARLYLLMVADTQAAGIGPTVEADRESITALFHGYIPERQLQVTTLSGNEVTPANILQTIGRQGAQGLTAGRDTLVFYYSGHGEYDQWAGDHVLTTSGGKLYLHRDVQAAANRLRPRATVIFSDACSVLRTAGPAAPAFPEPPAQVAPLFAALFFDVPPGTVPISASMKGQIAGCDNNGGYFTFALCECLQRDSQRRLGWPTVLKEINRTVRGSHSDTHQTAYIIGAESSDPSPRFGVTAQATPRSRRMGGVEVTLVLGGYPGTAMKRPGDDKTYYLIPRRHIITHINGEAVGNYAEFVNAVRNSPKEMDVTVYDPVKDTVREFHTTLRD
jgi:hypothetical protein